MATLVLSTAGTMLGGPIGGAIGGMIGQSIDQQWLGGGLRRGPRVGDLAVQSSTYGTPIPQIYGTMRVAGTIVWATDLVESETLIGAKGQPQSTVYSYSVSLAVALSSRPVHGVNRIWADGKLLRGAQGDFKVGTKFRFYTGEEEQALDPLIASVEGISSTPAYRGLALAVFEDLQLAEYGNRIPFLTFEVEGDAENPRVSTVLAEVGRGAVDCSETRRLIGYAAYGANIRSAVQPIVDGYGIKLSDDGSGIRSPTDVPIQSVADDQLGCVADEGPKGRVRRTRIARHQLPILAAVSYYDPARDYQAGRQEADSGERGGAEVVIDLPVVTQATEAKAIAYDYLMRLRSGGERISISLPPSFLGLQPGAHVRLPDDPREWRVEEIRIDGFAIRAELVGVGIAPGDLSADGGRAAETPDIVASPTRVALFDLPSLDGSDQPAVYLAAATASPGWRPVAARLTEGSNESLVSTATRQTVMGAAIGVLGNGQAFLFDCINSIDVQLADVTDWLTSCTDEMLLEGANVAALGSEIFQFGAATPLGSGRFRLSRLLRGRRGTEWAMAGHAPGEAFALLNETSFMRLELHGGANARPISILPLGLADAGATAIALDYSGESCRPPSPVRLTAYISGGELRLSWVRRSRLGWDWPDGVEVPLGEQAEIYRVTVQGANRELTLEASEGALSLSAAQVASLGSGPASVSVRQVGDRALSRPATCTIIIP